MNSRYWVALNIGNTHLRWAYFDRDTLIRQWVVPHTSNRTDVELNPKSWSSCCDHSPAFQWHQQQPGAGVFPSLLVASVVGSQTDLWRGYPVIQLLSLGDVPLLGLYESFGLDRAIALWGAGNSYGWPVLVIDAGTALTFTGSDQNLQLQGGAIAPGLGLQLAMLSSATSALPLVSLPERLPTRWALSTATAMQSGVIYGTISAILEACRNWEQRFPASAIVMTGGDSSKLMRYLKDLAMTQSERQALATLVQAEDLIFTGMKHLWLSHHLSN